MPNTELPAVVVSAEPDIVHTATDPVVGHVVLRLRDRIATFDAVRASTVPDLTHPCRPDAQVYLTRRLNVVWHDQHRRSMNVYTLDEFVARFSDAPISWVIDDLLAAVPMPVEHLEI